MSLDSTAVRSSIVVLSSKRTLAVDQQFQPGEIAGVLVEQPVRPPERVEDIAVVVEHGEGIGMLDRSGPAVGQGTDRRNVELMRVGNAGSGNASGPGVVMIR